MRKQHYFLLLCGLLFTTSCSQTIYPDRSQFLKDGDFVPTVDLSRYRSVQERPDQEADMAVAMSISGGGSRAANFGIGVMMGLEKIILKNGHTALQEIDYLSTVSGGGFAGGSYLNSLFDQSYYEKEEKYAICDCVDECIRECLKFNYAGVLVKSMFKPKLWFTLYDDGDQLEKAIDDYVLGYKERRQELKVNRSIRLGDMFIPKENKTTLVKYPMMFANGTVYDKMVIFPFSPDILEKYKVTGWTHRVRKTLDASPLDLPLSVGIKASGSFPVLISNTTLFSNYHPERKFLHVLDGAMTDNFGYYTALEVLKQDTATRKVMFIIDADAAGNSYTFSNRESAPLGVSVFGRLASSGLDARRVLVEKDLNEVSDGFGFEPIFFSFNRLILNNSEQPPAEIKKVKLVQQDYIIRMKKDLNSLTNKDLQILYDLITNIGTKYSITEEEQELLLLTGQKIVQMQEAEIRAALEK
ncbi:MAG: patatin-like phospholipase family protein [Saprospiraceae bacterium]